MQGQNTGGGRSSRTFIREGLWDQLLAKVKAGDTVLIQFGHNDSHGKGQPESTDADTGYTDNLRCMVRAATSKTQTSEPSARCTSSAILRPSGEYRG